MSSPIFGPAIREIASLTGANSIPDCFNFATTFAWPAVRRTGGGPKDRIQVFGSDKREGAGAILAEMVSSGSVRDVLVTGYVGPELSRFTTLPTSE